MIADDIRLDLVNRTRMRGKTEASRYFGNDSATGDWRLVPGPRLIGSRPRAGARLKLRHRSSKNRHYNS